MLNIVMTSLAMTEYVRARPVYRRPCLLYKNYMDSTDFRKASVDIDLKLYYKS